MSKKINNPKAIAFWSYDRFPWMLSAEVSEITSRGDLIIPAYGYNAKVNRPSLKLLFLDISEGRAFVEQLSRMEAERRSEINLITEKYETILADAIEKCGAIKS